MTARIYPFEVGWKRFSDGFSAPCKGFDSADDALEFAIELMADEDVHTVTLARSAFLRRLRSKSHQS